MEEQKEESTPGDNTADIGSADADNDEEIAHRKMMEESEKVYEESAESKELKEKIIQEASKKYTKEEINAVIKMGEQMASKAVLTMLISVIEEGPTKGFDKKECSELVRLVKQRMKYEYSGYMQCEFDEIDFKLNISLTIADRVYQADISIPDARYAKDLYDKYNFLKRIAVAFWAQFVEENNALFKRICAYRKDVNFAELVVDQKSPTTLYFDPDSKKRVGILPYYVDAQGRPLLKK